MSAVLSTPLPGGTHNELGRRLRAELVARQRIAIERFESRPEPTRLLRERARNVDHVLAQCWHAAGLPAHATLVAMGGYGRGELFPYSDVDVLVLLPEPADANVQTAVESL